MKAKDLKKGDRIEVPGTEYWQPLHKGGEPVRHAEHKTVLYVRSHHTAPTFVVIVFMDGTSTMDRADLDVQVLKTSEPSRA